MGFSGFAWERLGIKNPAKSDNLRGLGTVWDCVKQTYILQAVVHDPSIINACRPPKQKQGTKQGALKRFFYF